MLADDEVQKTEPAAGIEQPPDSAADKTPVAEELQKRFPLDTTGKNASPGPGPDKNYNELQLKIGKQQVRIGVWQTILAIGALAAAIFSFIWSERQNLSTANGQPSSTTVLATSGAQMVSPTATSPVLANMMFIASGQLQMGSSDSDQEADNDERPVHLVNLSPFWIDHTEVTNQQYENCVRSGACTAPHSDSSATRQEYYANPDFATYPVIYVDWFQAAAYCAWAGKRLPSEAEWEYAASGPQDLSYPWGNEFAATPSMRRENRLNLCDAANCAGWEENPPDEVDDGRKDTAPVGSYPDGASWSGALDMAGNVWEWVADWYRVDYYTHSPSMDPPGPFSPAGKDLRVLRGGAWDFNHRFARTTARLEYTPTASDDSIGFRCAYSETLPAVQASLIAPAEGQEISLRAHVAGRVAAFPRDRQLWLLVQTGQAWTYYPQPGPMRLDDTGAWSAYAQVGTADILDAGREYTIHLALADSASSWAFQDFLAANPQPDGLALPAGVKILDSVKVRRVNPEISLDSHISGATVGNRETVSGPYRNMDDGWRLYGMVELGDKRSIPYGPFDPSEASGRWSIEVSFPWPSGTDREIRFHTLAVLSGSPADSILSASVGFPLHDSDLRDQDRKVIFGPLTPLELKRSERLVFASDKPGNDDIYVVNADGSSLDRLTGNPAEDTDPAWSRDGQWIAFASRRDGPFQIYIIDAAGATEARRLVPGREFPGRSPSWSPDGQWIVFHSEQDGNTDLYKAPVSGGEPVRLTDDPENDWDPDWSPDGSKILFVSRRAEDDAEMDELFTIDPTGGNLARLTRNENWEQEPAWSAEGGSILFAMDNAGSRAIYRMKVDTSEITLAADRDFDGYPSYAPGGERFVFHSSVDRQQLILVDGGELKQIDTGLALSHAPAWSPITGDERIAFSGRTDGDWEIYSMWDDGSDLRRLTDNHANDIQPRLSPDGRQMAFSSNIQGNHEIFIASALEQSEWTRLTDFDADCYWPSWSPDGRRIAYSSKKDGDYDIYVINTTGTGLLQVTDDPSEDTYPFWTPDGQSLVFHSKRSGNGDIYLANLANPTRVVPLVSDSSFEWAPELSPDGLSLLFTSSRDSGDPWATEIYAMNLFTGEVTRLTDDTGADWHPHWSSDGKRIYFTSVRMGLPSDIWVMGWRDFNPRDLTNEYPAEGREDTFGP